MACLYMRNWCLLAIWVGNEDIKYEENSIRKMNMRRDKETEDGETVNEALKSGRLKIR